jgi:hypothetical protein
LIISANFLFDCSGPARPCNSHNNFILVRTLFLLGVRFLTRRSHVIYKRKIPRKNLRRKKDRIDGLRHSTNTKSPRGAALATLACDTPREKSPKGAAGLAQQVRKIEVFFERLSEQKSPKGAAGLAQQVRKIEVFFERLSEQKSPKGAAGLAQQVCKIEVFFERLSEQKSPKGAAGLAQQVRKIEVFFKRLSVQKSPKGAAGLAQQVRKIEVFLKRLSVQKSPKGATGLIQQARQNASALHPCTSLHQETIRAQTNYRRSRTNIINAPDQARNAPIDIAGYAKAHSLIIQTIVTHLQRGHHTLHRFNLRNDSHLPIVK